MKRIVLIVAALILIAFVGVLFWPNDDASPSPTALPVGQTSSTLAASDMDGWCCMEGKTSCMAMQRAAYCLEATGRFFHADQLLCDQLCAFSAR